MSYPKLLSERDTLEAVLKGTSIARVGDGELRLAMGGKSISQVPDMDLAMELRTLMSGPTSSLVCIPNSESQSVGIGKPVMWGPTRYASPEYVALYGKDKIFGSSFVSRPDSAPWIDNDAYWSDVRKIWYDKDVTLVIGEHGGSFTHLLHARSVRLIYGPSRDAYAAIDMLEQEIGRPGHTVMICLGATATVLAERLAKKGVHALDLGHMGRFMPQRFLQRETH
jgi:hypothetical protein